MRFIEITDKKVEALSEFLAQKLSERKFMVRKKDGRIYLQLGAVETFGGVETYLIAIRSKAEDHLKKAELFNYCLESVSFKDSRGEVTCLFYASSEAYETLKEHYVSEAGSPLLILLKGLIEIPTDQTFYLSFFKTEERNVGISTITSAVMAEELLRRIKSLDLRNISKERIGEIVSMIRLASSPDTALRLWRDMCRRSKRENVDPKDLIRVLKRLANHIDENLSSEMIETLLETYGDELRDQKNVLERIKDLQRLRDINEERIKSIAEKLKKYFEKNYREKLIHSIVRMLKKSGVSYDTAWRLIDEFAIYEGKDPERLYTILDAVYDEDVASVAQGSVELKDLLREILAEKGLNKYEIEREVSEVLIDVYSLVGIEKIPRTAWLIKKGDQVIEWVYAGETGIYLFKRSSKETAVQAISNAEIKKVNRVKIIGLELPDLYRVYFKDADVIGSLDEVVSFISRKYGIESRYKYAVERVIQHLIEGEEELFYSPGPWIVNGRIVFIEEPGYTPPWKREVFVKWRVPKEDVDEDLKKKALEAVKRLVEAYKDPGKPALVLSYGAVAPIAYYVRKTAGVIFHMIIHGAEETGKTLLIDLLKEIFGVEWAEPTPRSDYGARVLLSLSTLPAMIRELGSLVRDFNEGKNDAVKTMDVLHRAASEEILKIAGGHLYGGYFYAVRVVVAATNEEVSMAPWFADKYILVKISADEAVDVKKASGCTPMTMHPSVKKALRILGIELLKRLEELLPEIDKLKNLSREEIRSRLIKIGYEAWKSLYKDYGLEPFPQPSEPETQREKEDVREMYREAFKSYIFKIINGKIKDKEIPSVYEDTDLRSENMREYLIKFEENHAIMINYKDGRRKLICKKIFLGEFKEYARRVYGLPDVGVESLIEIQGLKRTSINIAGKEDRNVLYIYL